MVYLAVIISFGSSCQKAEKIEKIPVESKLCVLGMQETGKNFEFMIFRTLSVLDNADVSKQRTDATVYLYHNGFCVDTIKYNALQQKYISKVSSVAGEIYSIKVSCKGFQDVYAETVMVNPVTVSGAVTYSNRIYGKDGVYDYTFLNNCRISTDINPGNHSNGMVISILEQWNTNPNSFTWFNKWTTTSKEISPLNTTEYNRFQPDITTNSTVNRNNPNTFICLNQESKILKIEFIPKDQKVKFAFTTYNRSDSMSKFVLNIRNMEKNAFEYTNAMALYVASEDNVFQDPVQLYSNIKNGEGVFGSYTNDTLFLKVK